VSPRPCFSCKHLREIVLTDKLDRDFCADCSTRQPAFRELVLATWAAENAPFRVGDKVACKTGGQIYDGVGHVQEVSTKPEDLASPVVPMFRVAIDEKAYPEMDDECWYSEVCLTKVDA
jgi:hypothetical protein